MTTQINGGEWIRAAKKTPPKKASPFYLTAGAVELQAAAGDGEGDAPRRFSIVAYTGGPMSVGGFSTPVVIDLEGMDVGQGVQPILIDHINDVEYVLGQTDKIEVKARKLIVAGSVYGESDTAKQVIALNDRGFKFQASVGARIVNKEFVPAGSNVSVNGRNWPGPLIVARKTVLGEVSFVVLGADDQTSANIAASAAEQEALMGFEQWLAAMGLTADGLTDDQRSKLQAKFDAEQARDKEQTDPPVKAKGKGKGQIKASAANDADEEDDEPVDPAMQIRATAAAESKRIAAIRKTCGGKFDDIEAKAIEEGWDATKTELEVLRAARPKTAPGGIVKDKVPTTDVLEAAFCQTLGLPDVEKQFKPEVLEAAHKNFRNIGLQEMVLIVAAANGYVRGGPGGRIHQGNIAEVFEHAFPMRASFSTVSLPTVFSNVANKELLAGYMEEDQTWREIAQVKSVRDFKAVTSFRLLDNMEYEQLAPDGKIKHGAVGEESYTRQAKTYAKMFSLTRVDIINDDTGAFDDLRTRLGAGAAKKLNNVFWTAFMDNSAFFTSGRANYITGSTTNLGDDGVGLQAGVTAFRRLRSPTADGSKRLGGRPRILLVPPELEFIAQRLFASTLVNTGGAATGASIGNVNVFAGKYRPVVSDWLSDSSFTGYSSTAWYLLREPAQGAPIAVSFLNGVQTPTVESAQADFSELGIQFRGYHDFGVDVAEYLAGVKVKGAA